MIMRLQHGIKDVTAFDQMAAPGAFADVDSCAGAVVDGGVADRNTPGHGNLHPGRLPLHPADPVNQAVLHDGVRRVVVGFGARG